MALWSSPSEFYTPGNSSPQEPARRVAMVVKAENTANPGKVAVLIPEGGVQLRQVASLLPYVGDLNLREIKFLGTGRWNDPEIWRESALRGGAFPAPDPATLSDFERRYKATLRRRRAARRQLRLRRRRAGIHARQQ